MKSGAPCGNRTHHRRLENFYFTNKLMVHIKKIILLFCSHLITVMRIFKRWSILSKCCCIYLLPIYQFRLAAEWIKYFQLIFIALFSLVEKIGFEPTATSSQMKPSTIDLLLDKRKGTFRLVLHQYTQMSVLLLNY